MTWQARLNITAAALVIGLAAAYISSPYIARYLWADQYKELMFQCDHAMREHFIAKKSVELSPNQMTIKNLEASEIGILKCHNYDKKRKLLMQWGLDSNDLSMIGLEVMEEKAYDLQDFVETHEFRY